MNEKKSKDIPIPEFPGDENLSENQIKLQWLIAMIDVAMESPKNQKFLRKMKQNKKNN